MAHRWAGAANGRMAVNHRMKRCRTVLHETLWAVECRIVLHYKALI